MSHIFLKILFILEMLKKELRQKITAYDQ